MRFPYCTLRLQQPTAEQSRRSVVDGGERQTCALGDVEEGVAAVGLVEHPQQGHVAGCGALVPADRSVEAATAELGLALGGGVAEGAVGLQHLDQACDHPVG